MQPAQGGIAYSSSQVTSHRCEMYESLCCAAPSRFENDEFGSRWGASTVFQGSPITSMQFAPLPRYTQLHYSYTSRKQCFCVEVSAFHFRKFHSSLFFPSCSGGAVTFKIGLEVYPIRLCVKGA